MNRTVSLLLLGVAVSLSTACADKRPRPQPAVYFSTSITADGGKFFIYRIETPERKESGERGDGAQRKDRGGRDGPPEQDQMRTKNRTGSDANQLEQQVDSLLARNRFCREGYFVLEQYSAIGGRSLRGECREGASAEDRVRFPNPV